ncbi:MAG: T9SS type A sorting domain-containing protein [Ignavibacteria bacterium]|nr:T9SS type A sorting domain-containing protein [Ignavibacteria bacterium]
MKKIFLITSLIVLAFSSVYSQTYPTVSIRDIQFRSEADLTGGNDASSKLGDTVTVVGLVMVPTLDNPSTTRKPIMWAGPRWQTYLVDTAFGSEWAGLNIIQDDSVTQLTNMDLLDSAQVVAITGVVSEFGTPNRQTQIFVLRTVSINFLSTKPARPAAVPVQISQFATGTTIQLTTGEKYEGMYVEFSNVFTSDRNLTNGTYAINDATGNKIFIHDQSGYFTRRSHQLRTWDPPLDGTTIDKIRGVIGTGSQGFVLRPIFPNDIVLGSIIPPAISSITRDQAVIAPSQAVQVTASITDIDGTISSAKLKYRVNGGTLNELNMTNTSGTTYTATIPGVTDSALVDYFVWAQDNGGNSSINPTDTSRSRYFYLVLNRPLTVQDIQYAPFGNGLGGYVNYRVTLRGIVTADTSDLRGDGGSVTRRAYIQNGTGPWSGIWVAGLTGDELRKGDDVSVSGLIREVFSHTAIDSITSFVKHSSGNSVPAAQLQTTGDIGGKTKGTVSAEKWEGVLIKFNNLTVSNENADGNPGPGGGGNSNFGEILITDGSGDLRLELQEGPNKYHNNWTTSLPTHKTTEVKTGYKFDSLTGVLFFSFSNYKLVPRKDDDFVGFQTSVGDDPEFPIEYSLKQNYPNPFNPNTVIEYSLPRSSNVSLKIYDVLGREVVSLVNNEFQTPGVHKYFFNANGLSSGIYLYKITADGFTSSKKMLLIK